MRLRRFAAAAARWWVAAILAPLTLGVLTLAGAEDGLCILSGTWPTGSFPELGAALGVGYVLVWLGAILVSPVLGVAGILHGAHAAARR